MGRSGSACACVLWIVLCACVVDVVCRHWRRKEGEGGGTGRGEAVGNCTKKDSRRQAGLGGEPQILRACVCEGGEQSFARAAVRREKLK
jgi:hypothetical protein